LHPPCGPSLGSNGGTSSQGWQRSSQISGTIVSNPQGEIFGRIDDLLIDENGGVEYAILFQSGSTSQKWPAPILRGGLLGLGDKLIPIPWKALKLDKEKNTLVVNIDKRTLEKAPNLDPEEWSKFTGPYWQKEVEIYYELPAIHAESR